MAINLTSTQKKAVDAISANDGVHVEFSKETGFISLVTTKALVKKGVLKYIGETGKWRKRTWVLVKQADPATCDICGEHQPHVATDGDVDVCDECADSIEVNNNHPRGNRIVWKNRQQAIYDCALHIVRERHVGFASATAWFDANVGKYAMLNTGNVTDNTSTVRTKFGVDVDKFAHANFGTLALEVEESAQPDNRPFITTDPASVPAPEILLLMPGEYPYTRPAQPKLSGELERMLRKPRLAQVIKPRVVDESVSERDLWDIWAKLGTDPVDYIPEPEPTPDPAYAAWQTKKQKNLWATVFVKAQDGTFATFAQDAATVTGVVYPQSKVIMTSYFLPTQINAQSKRVLSLEKATAALRAANKSYVVFVGDSVIMQFVAGRESGMSGMKLGAGKDRRMAG